MTGTFLAQERDGAVVTLVMNEPATRNALSGNSAVAEFVEACGQISRDDSVRAVIITGSGSAFSAGGNLAAMRADWRDVAEGTGVRRRLRTGVQGLSLALYDLEVPLIAAINGPAIGGGCDLACLCDIRIASDRARFSANFVKLGLIPALGGAWLLPRIIGVSRAAQLCLSGAMFDAAAALSYGLVSEVVPHDALRSRAAEIARGIAAQPGDALRLTKSLLRSSSTSGFAAHLEAAAALQALCLQSSAHEAALTRLRGHSQTSERRHSQ